MCDIHDNELYCKFPFPFSKQKRIFDFVLDGNAIHNHDPHAAGFRVLS